MNQQVRGLRPVRQRDADRLEHVLQRRGELLGDRRRADPVLEDQRETDDPGEELAHRRVGVGVRASGDRDHRAELRVAQRREERRQAGQQVRQNDGRTGALDAGPDGGEDSAADHGSQAHLHEVFGRQRTAQPLALAELTKLLDGAGRKERGHQGHIPRPFARRGRASPSEGGSRNPGRRGERRPACASSPAPTS